MQGSYNNINSSRPLEQWSKSFIWKRLGRRLALSRRCLLRSHFHSSSDRPALRNSLYISTAWNFSGGNSPFSFLLPQPHPLSPSPALFYRTHTRRSLQNCWQQHPSPEAFKCIFWWGNYSVNICALYWVGIEECIETEGLFWSRIKLLSC
jgi:hypothetical protein